MGFLDELKRLVRRETADAKAWMADTVAGGNAHLDEAERRQSADPEERLQATLEDISASDDAFAAIRAKADAAAAKPMADAELADAGPPDVEVVDVQREGSVPPGTADGDHEGPADGDGAASEGRDSSS